MSQSSTTSEASNNSNNQVESAAELPTTFESALERIKELRSKRDSLLAQKEKSTKEIEKLTKSSRLATLRTLIPRELYKHQDSYDAEVEKVYNYKNMTDDEIADIYQTKLRSIDLGQRRAAAVEQHKASSAILRGDQYSHFREVPNFSNNSKNSYYSSISNSDVMKIHDLMKRIAGSDIYNNNNNYQ